jgi:hypothetical protein
LRVPPYFFAQQTVLQVCVIAGAHTGHDKRKPKRALGIGQIAFCTALRPQKL